MTVSLNKCSNFWISPLSGIRFSKRSCFCTRRGSQSRSQAASCMAPTALCRLCTASPCRSSPASWPGCTLSSPSLSSQVATCVLHCALCVCHMCSHCGVDLGGISAVPNTLTGFSSSYGFPLNAGCSSSVYADTPTHRRNTERDIRLRDSRV